MPTPLTLTSDNLAVLSAGGHPVYLVRTADAETWDYHLPITVRELPGVTFKRHLLLFETAGHRQALELELVAGGPLSRRDLLGKTLVQQSQQS